MQGAFEPIDAHEASLFHLKELALGNLLSFIAGTKDSFLTKESARNIKNPLNFALHGLSSDAIVAAVTK